MTQPLMLPLEVLDGGRGSMRKAEGAPGGGGGGGGGGGLDLWKGGRGETYLLMLPHEVLDVSVLALLSLMNLLLAPQLSIIPQSLQKRHRFSQP